MIVPSPSLQESIEVGRANNNLDVRDFDGLRYLVWRAAPHHLASSQARLVVASSSNQGVTWSHHKTFALGRDVREPRLFEFDGRLHLYFFTAGTTWRRFEPDRIHVSILEHGSWSEPRAISGRDHVVWRVRWLEGLPIMTVYRGASSISRSHPVPPRVEFWTTDDGVDWTHLTGLAPSTAMEGTETEIISVPDHGYVTVTRKDGPGAYGSDISSSRDLGSSWHTRTIPLKLDSPFLFEHAGVVLLIARRSLGSGGRFDLGGATLPAATRTRINHAIYGLRRKRTALWRIDPATLSIEHLVDLPGHGDTCFPGLVDEGQGRFRVFNYTSPLEGPDLPWVVGMFGRTIIYETVLEIGNHRSKQPPES